MVLDEKSYYTAEANQFYWSVSQYKSFLRCPAAAMAELRGECKPKMTRAMLVGSFVDNWMDGTLEAFKKEHPEVFTKKQLLRVEFRKADEIIKRIQSDERFMKYLSGEHQKIMAAEFCGVPWKIKIDSYHPNICIADLKVVANFYNIPRFRYDLQGAVYQRICESVTGTRLPFYLVCATKEAVTNFDIFQIDQPTLDMALREIEGNMPRFIAVKAGLVEPHYCGVCDYCKGVKKARIRNYSELLEG